LNLKRARTALAGDNHSKPRRQRAVRAGTGTSRKVNQGREEAVTFCFVAAFLEVMAEREGFEPSMGF
jgi:hypothetical protein